MCGFGVSATSVACGPMLHGGRHPAQDAAPRWPIVRRGTRHRSGCEIDSAVLVIMEAVHDSSAFRWKRGLKEQSIEGAEKSNPNEVEIVIRGKAISRIATMIGQIELKIAD